jgi:hypothetical protein
MIIDCLITKDTLPLWVQAIGIFGTVYLAWATLKNKETLDQLVKNNSIQSDRLKIESQEQFKRNNPYLVAVAPSPNDPRVRAIILTNIGATLKDLKVQNHKTNTYGIDQIQIGTLANGAEYTFALRFEPGVEFDNIEFDICYKGYGGFEKIQRFHKNPGFPALLDPPAEYVEIQ